MGTRGLLGHILRSKKIRKGSYNHFDSYPTGLGRDLANFVNSLTDEQIEKMMEMIGKIEWIQDERTPAPHEVIDRYTAFGFADLGVGGQKADDWYCLLRNVQRARCRRSAAPPGGHAHSSRRCDPLRGRWFVL